MSTPHAEPELKVPAMKQSVKDIETHLSFYNQRRLCDSVRIPSIECEMQILRPVRLEDMDFMDEINAWAGSSTITGMKRDDERSMVESWVKDSVAWSMGEIDPDANIDSSRNQRSIGWTMQTRLPNSIDPTKLRPIGMIFLTELDGWSRSARLQVILGKDFRGRSYSRDAMPRVMTYGFASVDSGEGLGLHRIITKVPEKNTRALSVYQSLGYTKEVALRDALWDCEANHYQDQEILSTIQDEYDPVRALDAFGMRVIQSNPGMAEALALHQHSLSLHQKMHAGFYDAAVEDDEGIDLGSARDYDPLEQPGSSFASGYAQAVEAAAYGYGTSAGQARSMASADRSASGMQTRGGVGRADNPVSVRVNADEEPVDPDQPEWPIDRPEDEGRVTTSKRAWWRKLGPSRKKTQD